MDGSDALPDPEAQRGKCRDEPECARLQSETGHESHGHHQLEGGPDSVKAGAFTIYTGAKAPKRLLDCFMRCSQRRNLGQELNLKKVR